jgi:hypothetical protein
MIMLLMVMLLIRENSMIVCFVLFRIVAGAVAHHTTCHIHSAVVIAVANMVVIVRINLTICSRACSFSRPLCLNSVIISILVCFAKWLQILKTFYLTIGTICC